MPKILHIATDEKFINSANWQFEKVFPKKNDFIIITKNTVSKLKFVELNNNITVKNWNKSTLNEIISNIDNYELVVLHGLNYYQSQIVINSPREVKFLWIIFGSEIYDNKLLKYNLYGKLTKDNFEKVSLIDFVKNELRGTYYKIFKRTCSPDLSFVKAARLVKSVGVLIDEEYNYLVDKNIVNKNTIFTKFSYYPIEFIFRGIENIRVRGNNILLGNSSSSSNNHLEIIKLLSKFQLYDKKVITPLSYGNKLYAEEICKIGKKELKDNFVPLLEFMSLDEYNKYLQQCSIVIMNHYRQQAVGNILAMIWMGAKVYLDERNPVYHYLKRIGIKVFSINDELNIENKNVFSKLCINDVNKNKEILKKEIGEKTILLNLKKSVNKIIFNEY